MSGWLIILFFLIHALLLYAAYKFLVLPRVEETERGAWLAIVWIGMLIPVVGELLGSLSYWLAVRYASTDTWLGDGDEARLDSVNLERLRQLASEDIDLIPLTDALQMDGTKRKQSITQLISTPLSHTNAYLHQGLAHEDSETVHYAATVRNTLFDRYESKIKQSVKRIDPDRPETLYPVIETYEAFFESGLLDIDMKRRMCEQAMTYLEMLGRHDATDVMYLRGTARLLLQSGSYEEGERFAEALVRHHPEKRDGYLMLIEYHMSNGTWGALRPVLDRLHQYVSDEDIPKDYRFIIRQLEGEMP